MGSCICPRSAFKGHHIKVASSTHTSNLYCKLFCRSRERLIVLFPTDFLIIPVLFYLVVLVVGFDLDMLRSKGWLFEVAKSEAKWYQFYTYFGVFHFDSKIPFTDYPRSHEDQVGPVVGDLAYAVRASVLQHLASSPECSCARCVLS